MISKISYREMNWPYEWSDFTWPQNTTRTYYFTGNSKYNYNIYNNKIVVDVPGFGKENIKLTVDKSIININLHKESGETGSTEDFPIHFDSQKYFVKSAECKNGQLTIFLEENKKDVVEIEVK